MKPRAIELYIDELVLDGFKPGDSYGIAEAIEGELTRLFAERGLPHSLARGAEVDRVETGTFQAAPDSRVGVVGTQVAQFIYAGFETINHSREGRGQQTED
jgi:hypothetical protein